MTQDTEPTMATQALHYAAYRNGSSLIRLYRLVTEVALCLGGQLVGLQRLARECALLAEIDDAALKDVGLSRADLRTALKTLHRWR